MLKGKKFVIVLIVIGMLIVMMGSVGASYPYGEYNWSGNFYTISKGTSRTYHTVCAQNVLNDLWYSNYLAPWGVDGDFGNATKSAVIAFQDDHDLTVDGIVGPQTWAELQDWVWYDHNDGPWNYYTSSWGYGYDDYRHFYYGHWETSKWTGDDYNLIK